MKNIELELQYKRERLVKDIQATIISVQSNMVRLQDGLDVLDINYTFNSLGELQDVGPRLERMLAELGVIKDMLRVAQNRTFLEPVDCEATGLKVKT